MLKLKTLGTRESKEGVLIIPVCENREIHYNKNISNLVKEAKKKDGFKGKKDEELILYDFSGLKIAIFIGIGKIKDLDSEKLRAFSGKAVKKCLKMDQPKISFAIPYYKNTDIDQYFMIEAIMEGAVLSLHRFDKYKTEKNRTKLKQIYILTEKEYIKKSVNIGSRVQIVSESVIMARDWINMPPNKKRPKIFIKEIISEAEKVNINVEFLDHKALKKQKLNALFAVGSGSDSKPGLIILRYLPDKTKKTIAIVGKGVTFDSGGINLKPSSALKGMKADMSGAAAAVGAIIGAAKLKLKKNIVAAIPVVENLPSGSSYRPEDIVKSYSGKTVEIGNTDAEGRLILIDAISYIIEKDKPHTLIDIATLTGACVVALGEKIAGVFSYDDKLSKAIIESGERLHERCWPLPMPEDYKELLKSEIADIQNVSSARWGGAITGALFISEFIKNTRWAHIDIAGPAYIEKETAYCGPGGTGFGVRLIIDFIKNSF